MLAIWQCYHLAGNAAYYLPMLPAIWHCFGLPGNASDYGNAADYLAMPATILQGSATNNNSCLVYIYIYKHNYFLRLFGIQTELSVTFLNLYNLISFQS